MTKNYKIMRRSFFLQSLTCCFVFLLWSFYMPIILCCQQTSDYAINLKSTLSAAKDDSTRIVLCNKLSSHYSSIDLELSKNYCDQAIKIYESTTLGGRQPEIRKSGVGEAYKNRAWYYYKKQNYIESLNDIEKAIYFYDKDNDRLNLGKAFTLLGNIYYRQNLYDIAEQHFTKSLQLLGIYQKDLGLTSLYLNYGGFLVNRKRYEEAWEMFSEALNIYKSIDFQGDWGLLYNNMGVCAGYLGRDNEKIEFYLKAVAQYEKHNNRTNIVNLHHNLGIAYQKQKQYELSIKHLKSSIQSAHVTGIFKFLPNTYETLSQSYFQMGLLAQNSIQKDSLYSQSLDYLERAKSLTDSLFNAQNTNQINELLTKYEAERKEKEIQKLNFQSELNQLEFRRQEFELQSIILASNAEKERITINQKVKEIAILKLEKENQFTNLELKIRNAKLIEQEALAQKQKSEIELLHQTKQLNELEQIRNKNLSSVLWMSLLVLLLVTLLILLLYFEKQKANNIMLKHNLEIEQQQKEIERQNVHLENINKFKDIFISNMSHEIRTPLNTIIGFSNLLAKANLNENQKQQVESIEFASENLLALVNDILDFSKLESGNIQFEFNEFDFIENLEKLISMFQYQADEKNLLLSLIIDNQVPKFVKTDKYRLNQIIINLIGNAIKFTEKGFVRIQVEVHSMKDGVHNIFFTISDTGSGIEHDHLERIFESYTQLNNYNYMNHNGTGLGLAICKRLVQLFGGKITVKSEIGRGSSFTFNIPIKASELSDTLVSKKHILTTIENKKILIVEDNTLNQTVIKTLLNSINETLHLHIVGNGQLALDSLKSDNFDLIFMDMKMPVMDGLTATSLIRQFNSETPIIALTANATKEEKQKCLDAGMNDFMVKPIDPNMLREKIDFWLSHV